MKGLLQSRPSSSSPSRPSSPFQLVRSSFFVLLAFIASAYAFPLAQRVAAVQVPAAAAALTANPLKASAPVERVERHTDVDSLAAEDKLALGLATLAALVVVQGVQSLR